MTNILTWDIKPIQLPKLNTNLLSVISFLMLLLMLFTTAATVVEAACEQEWADLQWAKLKHGAAYFALISANALLVAALLTLNPFKIAGAILAVDLAAMALASTGATLLEKQEAYDKCLSKNHPGLGSGECDSGNCSG